jgi:lipopolysaccharide/colanic/teichoic acid biosynthesis glycosyltransferase
MRTYLYSRTDPQARIHTVREISGTRRSTSGPPGGEWGNVPKRRGRITLVLQRTIDMICAAGGLLVLFPAFCAIALAIKIDDGGPVFYRHRRVGRGFRQFDLLKFRTMVPQAETLGGQVTVAGDPRVTRRGRFLRKYKLDELPQLINVLKGEMSLVGARPEVQRYVEMFRSEYEAILVDRPGITDPASLAFRHEEEMLWAADTEHLYISEVLPSKLSLSLEYSRRRNVFTDLGIIFSTIVGIACNRRGSRGR